MALSTKWLTSNSYIEYWLEYYTNSQNVTANTSSITVKLWIRRNNTGYETWGSGTSELKIDGATYTGTITPDHKITSTARCLLEKTVSVSHASDGKKSISIECYITHNQFSTTRRKITYTLNTIPRASSVTCNDGNIGSSTTINITRASSSFTHTLRYRFYSGYKDCQGVIVSKTNNTSIGWTIPTEFYGVIPHKKTGWGEIFCDTYSGNQLIGTTTCKFWTSVTNSEPNVSITIKDINSLTTNLTGNNQKLIRGQSNANIITSASAKNEAWITEIEVICSDGKRGTGSNVTLNGVQESDFTIKVTDSRGFVINTTKKLNLIDYIPPAITDLKIFRLETTSPLTKIVVRGNIFNGSFGSVSNARQLSYFWRENGSNSWSSEISLTPTSISGDTFNYEDNLSKSFDVNKSYDFLVRIKDKITNSDKVFLLGKSTPIITAYKDGIDISGFIKQDGNNIIESGSNVNGEYTKFADGTLICRKEVVANLACTYAWGTLFETTTPLDLGSWPYSFVGNNPRVVLTATDAGYAGWIAGRIKGTTTSAAGLTHPTRPNQITDTFGCSVIGIGRWKA